MALIYCNVDNFKHYIVNPYWSSDDWYIQCTDNELIIGVSYIRNDISDKALLTKMRRTLRILQIKGKPYGDLLRDSRVFRCKSKGGDISYELKKAGMCNLSLNGPIQVNLNEYLDHGDVVIGLADLENQTIYNKESRNVRKKNHSKAARKNGHG